MAYRIPPRVEHAIRFTAIDRLQGAQRQVGDDVESLKRLGRQIKDYYDSHIGNVVVPREWVLLTIAAGVLALAVVGIVTSQVARNDVVQTPAPVQTVQLADATSIDAVSDGKEGRSFALAGGIPLFPLPVGSVEDLADKPIEMQNTTVQSYVPNVGFWVGENTMQRMFVVMRAPKSQTDATLALPVLSAGQKINLSGYVRALPTTVDELGVPDANDQAQLAMAGYRIEANSVRVTN